MPLAAPAIDRAALLARLGDGAAAPTVVTPNQRLVQALTAEHDARQLAEGRGFWTAPDILSWSAFLARCHEEARYAPSGGDVPALLGESAEAILWEEAIRASRWRESLLALPATAALASEAWTLVHAWRLAEALEGEQPSEDCEAFCEWAKHYARRTQREGLTDRARLPAVVAPLLAAGAISRPAMLVLYAFDLITPQQSEFLQTCARFGVEVVRCDPPGQEGEARRTLLETPRVELEHAARWARARLEAAGGSVPRIAIVVPDLAQRRREVARLFARVFSPNPALPEVARAPLYNLSLGEPLTAYPLVDCALTLLEFATGTVAYDRASRLIRSPFLEGGEDEAGDRARLDAALRRVAPANLTLTRLRTLIPHAVSRRGAPACARLVRLLERVLASAGEGARAPAHEWARRFTGILDAAGFPGQRTLDSAEYQALMKWREVLGDYVALGSVSTSWSTAEARSRLQRLCEATLFQPKSGDAPVQVLGLLESAGLAFDHLWVSGLTSDAWPIAARAHPLVSPALQRDAGIPQASPEESLQVDRRITAAWLRAAPEVVFSSARADGDRELLVSPLANQVVAVDAGELAIPDYPQLRKLLFAARRGAVEKHHDDLGPRIAGGAAKGGTGILVDQAACPFRAFAHFRLDARSLERPEPGLAPVERGSLLHAMMAKLWESLKDQRTLAATDEATLVRRIDEAAAHAIHEVREERPGRLDGRFAELERKRIADIAREWLRIEAARSPFEVLQREERWKLSAGNLRIDGRIDRVDRLDGGGLAIIDYKTGRVNVADWMGERPDNAQLPLYALAADEEDVCAVAFASLKTGDLRFAGVSRDDNALPRVDRVEVHRVTRNKSWTELLASWRVAIDRLGEDFAAGAAQVDPKEMLATCKRCDLKSLCRVHERLSPLDEGDELEDAAEEDGE